MAELLLAVMHERALKRERRFRDRLDSLSLNDQELISHYRFPRHQLIQLIEEMEPFLGRRTRRSRAIPTHTQVLVILRVLASGSFQHVVGDTSVKFSLTVLYSNTTTKNVMDVLCGVLAP